MIHGGSNTQLYEYNSRNSGSVRDSSANDLMGFNKSQAMDSLVKYQCYKKLILSQATIKGKKFKRRVIILSYLYPTLPCSRCWPNME